jgi:hypothetical protein
MRKYQYDFYKGVEASIRNQYFKELSNLAKHSDDGNQRKYFECFKELKRLDMLARIAGDRGTLWDFNKDKK